MDNWGSNNYARPHTIPKQTELWNGVTKLAHIITAYAKDRPEKLTSCLPYAIWAYNSTKHASTQETPFFLMYNRDPQEPGDLKPPSRFRLVEDANNVFSQRWHEALDLALDEHTAAQQRQKMHMTR